MPSNLPEVTCRALSGALDAPTQRLLARFCCTEAMVRPSAETEADTYELKSFVSRRTPPPG